MTTDEHSSEAVIRWIRLTRTTGELRKLWTEELTAYSRALPDVETVKDEQKEKLK